MFTTSADAERGTAYEGLGRCLQCKGKLIVKGTKICCGQCGLPVQNHPRAVKPEPERVVVGKEPTPAEMAVVRPLREAGYTGPVEIPQPAPAEAPRPARRK